MESFRAVQEYSDLTTMGLVSNINGTWSSPDTPGYEAKTSLVSPIQSSGAYAAMLRHI